MNASDTQELNSIIAELNGVIAELEDISSHLRADFTGIGTEFCAAAIDNTIPSYRTALGCLNNLDRNNYMQWFRDLMGWNN